MSSDTFEREHRMRFSILLLLTLAGFATIAPIASAEYGAVPPSVPGKSLILCVAAKQKGPGRIQFGFEAEGFKFKNVTKLGQPNAPRQGHVNVYARVLGQQFERYVGWSDSGKYSWTMMGMLKPGTTYILRAVFAFNDNTEDPRIQSQRVKVTL